MEKKLTIKKMKEGDLDAVMQVERASFPVPWTRGMFIDELKNETAHYFAAFISGKLAGYCGMWRVVNEGHITNVAVAPEYRRRGVGEALMRKLVNFAKSRDMIGITLEVRMGNAPAMGLYAKFGFKPEGIRKGYYETGEDAVIMWLYFNADKENLV